MSNSNDNSTLQYAVSHQRTDGGNCTLGSKCDEYYKLHMGQLVSALEFDRMRGYGG